MQIQGRSPGSCWSPEDRGLGICQIEIRTAIWNELLLAQWCLKSLCLTPFLWLNQPGARRLGLVVWSQVQMPQPERWEPQTQAEQKLRKLMDQKWKREKKRRQKRRDEKTLLETVLNMMHRHLPNKGQLQKMEFLDHWRRHMVLRPLQFARKWKHLKLRQLPTCRNRMRRKRMWLRQLLPT